MMDKATGLVIRPARAEDANAAIPLIYSSGPKVWDLLFGNGEPQSSLSYLRDAWISGLGVAGFKAYWLAEQNGQVLASVSVYDRRGHKKMGDETAKHALRYFGWRLVLRLRWLIRVSRHLMKAPSPQADYVANFGVAPEARGQGIGSEVLRYFSARAESSGKQLFELDVALDNPRGQVLYERFGMVVAEENHDPVFAKRGIGGTRRMRMPLG